MWENAIYAVNPNVNWVKITALENNRKYKKVNLLNRSIVSVFAIKSNTVFSH